MHPSAAAQQQRTLTKERPLHVLGPPFLLSLRPNAILPRPLSLAHARHPPVKPTHRTLIFVIALAAVALFIAAARLDPLPGDETLAIQIQQIEFPGMLPLMQGITTLGSGVLLAGVGLALAVYSWATHFRAAAYAAAATLLIMPPVGCSSSS